MKEHPIIYSTEMVRAILDGRKTQTRRIIKNPHKLEGFMLEGEAPQWCPYGQVGDRLWVRESYYIGYANLSGLFGKPRIISGRYIADNEKYILCLTPKEWDKLKARQKPLGNSSAGFMYKSIARIFLEITNIRVERVQDINLYDCKSEGISDDPTEDWCELFKQFWDSLNAKRGYGWDKNLFVWVIEFKRKENP